jgi:osmoprotectant transport system permease protein
LKTLILCGLILISMPLQANDQVVVGSKIFTESYILGEIAAQNLENSSHLAVDRKLGMGSTGVLFEALKIGAIDLYPDYSGTIAETILKNPRLKSLEEIRAALSPLGLTISDSLGFNNTYALAVKESVARKYKIEKISDLKNLTSWIRAAFSYEFMDRQDGYHGMINRYQLEFLPAKVSRMEHSLVYRAIDDNAVDLIEVYSTDANIKKFELRVLQDDLNYFPRYEAVWLATQSFVEKHPEGWRNLLKIQNKISAEKMITMNASADIEKSEFSQIAADFLGVGGAHRQRLAHEIWQRTKEHLRLVGISVLFSIVFGIPLGVFAARSYVAGQSILLLSALIQTIPTLALLCFLIPIFGVGIKPAIVALCLYSLLPVVLNTFTGIRMVDRKHIENAKAFGLSQLQIMTKIVLPIASPTILAGVKTATIVGIGTATLAALIGAGGYGALIISGLSLNNMRTILMGAIPAALLALAAHFLFNLIGNALISKGLRK